jgi:hypothetical protein
MLHQGGVHAGNKAQQKFPEIWRGWEDTGFMCPKSQKRQNRLKQTQNDII